MVSLEPSCNGASILSRHPSLPDQRPLRPPTPYWHTPIPLNGLSTVTQYLREKTVIIMAVEVGPGCRRCHCNLHSRIQGRLHRHPHTLIRGNRHHILTPPIPTSMGVTLCTFCKIHWSIGRPGMASAVRDYSNLLKGNILTAVATYERYF